MSICPKGKTSKSRRDKRKAQSWKIALPSLVSCNKCGRPMKSHRACKYCGTYNSKEVISVAK